LTTPVERRTTCIVDPFAQVAAPSFNDGLLVRFGQLWSNEMSDSDFSRPFGRGFSFLRFLVTVNYKHDWSVIRRIDDAMGYLHQVQ
jgi:hypothetical protein